uniref:Pentatricopeptide repeat-containing protein n=2 Tax=Solanum lycopersicum TaxID=4081 RepID=A0A3Q7FTD6_SOLLC
LGMIINESVRLYPPAVAAIRRAKVDTQLGDFTLPRGTELLIPIIAIHHDQTLWGQDANEFNPARFGLGVAQAAKHPMAFMPFGLGARRCAAFRSSLTGVYRRFITESTVFRPQIPNRREMQPLLLVSEESQFLLRILNGSFQTLDIIKDRIFHDFANLFCSKANLDVIDMRQENVMHSVNRDELGSKDWSSKGNNSNPEGDSTAGFSVLDTMLKRSLDRLKSMRERISLAEAGINYCTWEINFNKDAYVVRAMCLDGQLGAALSLWWNMIQNSIVPDVITHNYLINALCKNGELEKAEWIVRGMLYRGPSPTCAAFNSLIRGYCLVNDVDNALNTFSTMANHGIVPNRVTCNILVHALCKKGLLEEANNLFHKLLSKVHNGGSSNLITSTIMMDGCFKNGDTDQALAFWERMLLERTQVDKVSYNVVIHGFCLSHDLGTAYKYCCEMLKLGFVPDVYSYNTLIGALCRQGKISDACYIYDVMTGMGVKPDHITYRMIIQGLCINREIDRANCFLDYMLEYSLIPEPLVWNVIINGYGRCGDIQKASYIREKMVACGVLPNIYTYNALIYAQIKSGNLSAAQSLEKELLLYGLTPDSVTYNLLIGAACNLGLIHSALQLHDKMLRKGCQPDVITYTELLKVFCVQGMMREADKLFGRLMASGLAVDHVPFLILMKRYCRMGEFNEVYDLHQKWLETMPR